MPDQVTIKFGPAKLNTPKAIRNSIADTAVQTQADTIAEVTNNTSINVGGSVSGTVAQVATIDTFDPYTNTGTATFNYDSITLNYTNATGSYLNPGDEVVILEDTNTDYTAVAVYQRMPSVPGSIPAAGIAPGFPIDVTLAPNRMGKVGYGGVSTNTCVYDEQGIYSGYSDTILNTNDNVSYNIFNGYSRSVSQSISLGINDFSSNDNIFIQTNGRIWKDGSYGSTISYKDNSGAAWVSVNTLLPSGITSYAYSTMACDSTNGIVWFVGQDNVGDYHIYYVLPTSTAVAVQFGSTIVNTLGNLGIYNLFADSGYLYMCRYNNSTNTYTLHTKSSSNLNSTTDPFVGMCGITQYNPFTDFRSIGKMAGSIDNHLYIVRDMNNYSGIVPTTIQVDKYGFSGITSIDTGLPQITPVYPQNEPATVSSISVSPSGFLVATFATNASYFGMGTGEEWLPGVMILNGSSIAYPFVDPDMMTSKNNSNGVRDQWLKVGSSNIVKRSDGSMIWVTTTADTSSVNPILNTGGTAVNKTRIYELTGL